MFNISMEKPGWLKPCSCIPFLVQQYIRPYVASLLAMGDDQILQISKDSGGSRVLESFLGSNATAKRKFKVFGK